MVTTAPVEELARADIALKGQKMLDPLSILALNLDVLHAIVGSIEQRGDLLSFMETCHASHFIGIPHLLKSTVYLSEPSKFESFRQFMFAGSDHTRFGFLHGLNIWVGLTRTKTDEHVLVHETVIIILQNAVNLQHLTVTVMDYDDVFRPTITSETPSALRSIQPLSPVEIGDNLNYFQEILMSLCSPISEISIGVVGPHGTVVDAPPALASFKDTLTTLRLQYFLVDNIVFQLPRVQVLSICAADMSKSFLGTLIQIFPNLRKLSVKSMLGYYGGCYGNREENRARFLEVSGRWSSLDSISGPLWLLFTLGIVLPIRHISTRCDFEPLDSGGHLMGLLQDVGPSTVALQVEYRELRDGTVPKVVHAASKSQNLRELYLEISICDDEYHPSDKLATVKEVMQKGLEGLTLTSLVLDFFCNSYDEYGYPYGISNVPMAMDIQEWAHALSYCIPSLQQLLIKIQIPRGKQQGWNIEWGDSGVRLSEMPKSGAYDFLRLSKGLGFDLFT